MAFYLNQYHFNNVNLVLRKTFLYVWKWMNKVFPRMRILESSDIENVNWDNESCCVYTTLILNWIYRGQKDVYETMLLSHKNK